MSAGFCRHVISIFSPIPLPGVVRHLSVTSHDSWPGLLHSFNGNFGGFFEGGHLRRSVWLVKWDGEVYTTP